MKVRDMHGAKVKKHILNNVKINEGYSIAASK
jgi:hypothetical protein